MTNITRSRPGRGYRPCVGIALFGPDGRVFLGKRATRGVVPQYSWQLPQGGIDPGEKPLDAAMRELYEETSVTSATVIGELAGWLHYDLPSDVAAWRGRYRGQAQRWFAFRFEGEDSEINVSRPPDGHPVEFSTWRWESLSAIPEVVVPFKRAVYEEVVKEFATFTDQNALLRGATPRAI